MFLRFQSYEAASKKKPLSISVPAERPSDYFGRYVFNQ